MAKKKKENEISYLQCYLPQGQSHSEYKKLSWSSFNKRQTNDTGAFTAESNICTSEAPYFTPAKSWKKHLKLSDENSTKKAYAYRYVEGSNWDKIYDYYPEGYIGRWFGDKYNDKNFFSEINIFPDGVLPNIEVNAYNEIDSTGSYNGERCYSLVFKKIVSVIKAKKGLIYFITLRNESETETKKKDGMAVIYDDLQGSVKMYICLFNGANSSADVDNMMLEYPIIFGKYTITDNNIAKISQTGYILLGLNSAYEKSLKTEFLLGILSYTSGKEKLGANSFANLSGMPKITYPCNFQSRLFGVNENLVFASGYNDYSNWAMDVEETNPDNAWMSSTQSNIKADGDFTAIVSYGGHVLCFRENFMQEIYNTKNPFRVIDIGEYGCLSQKSVCEVNGILYFASQNGIYAYNGSKVSSIGYEIKADTIKKAILGSELSTLFVYMVGKNNDEHLYTYDTLIGAWSERSLTLSGSEAFGGVAKSFVPRSFTKMNDKIYMITEAEEIYCLSSDEYNLDWYFETDFITAKTVDIKHIRKMQILADVASNASFKVFALYDDEVFNENTSHLLFNSDGKTGQFPIRVKPRTTANYGFKLHVKGTGYVKLYELELHFTAGGELFK
mgnify:CR=1 FL=1